MGTRWKTQHLHLLSCHPSSSATTIPSATPAYTDTASASTHSLPLHFNPDPSPSPLPSTPIPPPLPATTSVAPASASAAAPVSALTSSQGTHLDPDGIPNSHLRHRSSSGALSRLRSHSASSLKNLLPTELITNFEPPPASTPAMAERPAIYVHFEFGVSWTPRQVPKNRQITYMSRSMRDRANHFPRQLPAPNTNFLTGPQPQTLPVVVQPQYEQPQYQLHNFPQQTAVQQPRFPREIVAISPPGNVSPAQQQINAQIQQQWETLLPRRTSRSQSRSSHERGRSAPPPFNDSPWDANPGSSSSNSMANNLPRDQRPAAPEIWKALPATPNQFRLGEDDMPWSSWTFPMGYPEDENDEEAESGRQSGSHHSLEISHESPRRLEANDRDKGKAREMQSLAAALVTVDNGFEDQWWYQGPRLVHVEGNIVPQAFTTQSRRSTEDFTQDVPSGSAAAWAVSPQETAGPTYVGSHEGPEYGHPSWGSFSPMTPRSSAADIVSPISEFSSPVPSFHGLHRSLTTRSDELHM